VLAGLGGRTVNQALADGVDAKTVWRGPFCEAFDVRHAALVRGLRVHCRAAASPGVRGCPFMIEHFVRLE